MTADVRPALRADRARNPLSLDEQRGTGKGFTLAETSGGDDPRLELVTGLVALRTLGVSSMPVSRWMSRTVPPSERLALFSSSCASRTRRCLSCSRRGTWTCQVKSRRNRFSSPSMAGTA